MVTPVPAPVAVRALADGEVPQVLIACVTYNSTRVVGEFLSALPAALEGVRTCRVVVVDNGSVDGTVELVGSIAPWVHLLRAPGNVGYAAGINLALASGAGSDGVFVLNPDAVPSSGSVAALLAVTKRDPQVGIAVPLVLSDTGMLKYSLRREPTLLRAAGEAILGGHRAARYPRWGDMVRDPSQYVDGARADWATGAAMFLTPAALDAVGAWDERYFLYSEETDYALRVRDAGLHLQLTTSASVTHPGGDMESSAELWTLVAVNRQRLYRTRHGLPSSTLYWLVTLANEFVRGLMGRDRSRLAVRALLALGPNQTGRTPTPVLIARTGLPWRVGRSPGSTPAT